MESESSTVAKRIRISTEGTSLSEVEGVVDADIEDFNSYFQEELKNEPLTKPERAAIKTYLAWHLLRNQ
jgi:hypothetical protein